MPNPTPSRPVAPLAPLPAGLGQRYEVRGELGKGATGTIYLAMDTFAQREVAFAEEIPSPRAATVIATSDGTIGRWPYARIRSASPGLQLKMLQIFFRLAAERHKQSDENYLRLHRQYAHTEDTNS